MNNNNVINWIYERHDVEVNQKYGDNLPYSFHLKMVVATGRRFKHLIVFQDNWDDVEMALAGHDLIEDARITYNDLVEKINLRVADIIYVCTDLRGKTRAERHGEEYINSLKADRTAVFVKMCDVLSNASFSRMMNSTMFSKYQKEFKKFKENFYVKGEYEELWDELSLILI